MVNEVIANGTEQPPEREAVPHPERRAAEAALQESEARFQAVWEATSEALALSDPSGIVLAVNPAYVALYGFSPGEVVGRPFSRIFPEAERPAADAHYRAVFTGSNPPPVYETQVQRADGTVRVVEARASFIVRDGVRVAMVSAIRDVSNRHAALGALRESEARLQAMLDQLPVGVGLADLDGNWLLTNAVLRRFVGAALPSHDPIHRARWRTWDPDGAEIPPLDWPGARALRGEAVASMDFLVTVDDGTDRWLRFRATPFRDAAGAVLGAIAVMEDVDALKRAAAERVAFVDAAVHDLRNPLTSLKGQVQLLQRRAQRELPLDGDALLARLAAIDAAADRMAALLEEMLDAAHVQAGRRLELRQDPTDLVVLVEATLEDAQARTTQHRIRLDSSTPMLVGQWDAARVARVLNNLLDNAVKYTPDGGDIVVRVHREADAARDWAVLEVRDQGIGIPAVDLPHLFERFHRGRNVRGIRGTGIGLAGVRQIVEQHGGTITVASEEGQGSTFTVRLPLLPPVPAL
jgi:PAS domain S-box-containing protein